MSLSGNQTTNSPRTESTPSEHRRYLLGILAVLLAVVIVYAPRLNDFFLSDDFHYLSVYSQADLAPTAWPAFIGGEAGFLFRPFFELTGWLTYYVFGLQPFWWHVINLLMHLLATLLVIILVRRFVAHRWAAVMAGGLFGLHFINTESVVWISARTSLLVTVFVLAAICLETRPRAQVWAVERYLALLLSVCALLSKEHAIVLPLLLLLVPAAPLDLTAAVPPLAEAGRHGRALRRHLKRFWPYWLLAAAFLVFRLEAITASTSATTYRLELGFNVLKNLVFVATGSLFAVDFRAALAAWNASRSGGGLDALAGFALAQPEVIVVALTAVLIWLLILLVGHPAARRLGLWVFAAALPVLFFRGTGERLLYLGVAGAAGAVAVTLVSWHYAFKIIWRRLYMIVTVTLYMIVVIVNIHWGYQARRDWGDAAALSRRIVAALTDAAARLPANARVAITRLPDNINGAWVFRSGARGAFTLYADRPDVTAVTTPDRQTDALLEWNGERFILKRYAAPSVRTAPQSGEP